MSALTTAPKVSTKSAEVYRQLRELIDQGGLNNGDRLSEAKLARRFGTSRGPIRESLLRLQSEGLLMSQGLRRSRVLILSDDQNPQEMLFRYQLRETIESAATRLAAKSMNGYQIDHLRTLANRVEEAEENARGAENSENAETRYQLAADFHQYLVSNCGNPLLLQVWDTHRLAPPRPLTLELERKIQARIAPGNRDKPSLSEVVDAIAAHDQDRAEGLMKQRIRQIAEAVRAIIWRE